MHISIRRSWAALAVAFAGLLFPLTAQANHLSPAVDYAPDGAVVGTFMEGGETITTFGPSIAVVAADDIVITFPVGTSLVLAQIAASDFLIVQADPDAGGACVAGAPTAPTGIQVDAQARTLTFAVAAASLSHTCGQAGFGTMTILLSGTAGDDEIQHPTIAANDYTFSVQTETDSGTMSSIEFERDDIVGFTIQDNGGPFTSPIDVGESQTIAIVAEDQYGNQGTGYTETVRFTSTDPDAEMPGDYTFQPGDLGARVFTNELTFETAGTHTVTVTDIGDGDITSTSASVVANPQLSFSSGPSDTEIGSGQTIQVALTNADGSVATAYTNTITLGIDTDPADVSLGGTTSVAAVDGVATFSGVSLSHAGTNYRLDATSPGLTTVVSTDFDVAPHTGGGIVGLIQNNSWGHGFYAPTPAATDESSLIASLLAQLKMLQAKLAALLGMSNSNAAANANANASFNRDLQGGSIGEDVKALQVWLNANGYVVAESGEGSAGQETTVFGPATKAALIKYQIAKGITPASGYFGAKTRASLTQ